MYRMTLVRHAETAWNAEGRLLGTTDLPLSPLGVQQAERLRDGLAGQRFTTAYASDMQRATATAMAILEQHPAVELKTLPVLREVSFGRDEGHPGSERTGDDSALLGGLAWRLGGWLTQLDPASHDGHLLIVSHGGPLRVMLCLLLGLPPERHWSFRLDCASVSVVDCAPGLVTLSLINDRSHLGLHP